MDNVIDRRYFRRLEWKQLPPEDPLVAMREQSERLQNAYQKRCAKWRDSHPMINVAKSND